ncbi:ISL3 family transposase (plasmid) [Bradyrhizobium sp. ISRA443]|uniref:ISL3 family transposase n=1 Tax=Bradyrhizobium sp. ISRA436 TaxID=2866195 RepID=UPI00247965E0|nr:MULTISPECIES: ISL3 family transposase [unclassified Bradyrhizobium]WGR90869.1 ISL3 family transposase [Bradyrhizobium sp. ISRA435]WGS03213.1 ISL3 family transposase [Bradyrhizobium sp. ISRA436]WGS10094.1 ISL3 family transposase [Bradyrhizobium sp. ISRA437]WGS16980.1 ISL3 family transposase [Bradyrhizobium sp. ISRA443]
MLCPCCSYQTRRVHSHYTRRLADLPWQGQVVEIRLQARRFRCANPGCLRRIFTERLPTTVRPRARRTIRLGESQLAIGFAVGGEPGSRLSHKLAMPVSGDTLLRMVHSAPLPDFAAPTVVGIDDWAWRRGQRYGTIICDLERNCVLDLLPDRNADSVARWLKSWPGIKIVARDRAGLYADGARCGAPNAVQVADRWHLLNSLGDALRHAVGRHRHNLAAAVQIMAAAKTPITGVSAPAPGLAQLRADRRAARRERWDEICRLRAQGCPTSGIGKLLGVDRRTVQRWLAAGGEPEHSRPHRPSHLLAPFEAWLEARWASGSRVGQQLWRELQQQGYIGSRVTIARWAANRREREAPEGAAQPPPTWKAPTRRRCAWYLSQNLDQIDAEAKLFLGHLFAQAPELATAAELAKRFVSLLGGGDIAELDEWIAQAANSELKSFANGIARDVDAVRAAITTSWTTSPVEGQISRIKAIKRQMYGRASYPLLRRRVLLAA